MSKKYFSLLFVTGLLLAFFSAKAVTNTATTSGAWETGTNWSQGHAPLATEDVVVPNTKAMTINAADVCLSLTINTGGSVTINGAKSISIAGNFSNSGTFTATNAGSTITFNAASNCIVSGTGAYTIAGLVVLNMGTTATALDVQSSNFCAALTGNFTLTKGTWRMDNAGTLANMYTGAVTKLTIPNTVVLEADQGTMDLCNAGTTGNVLLEGELFMNGGSVYVESGQGFNAGDDFQYKVVGAVSPILNFVSGNLYVFAGFNANTTSDYINFNMSGGTMTCAYSVGGLHGGYSNNGTFQLQDVVGGQTVMTGGTVILQDADNSPTYNDLDMGGSNVAATHYAVTGGTIQFGGPNTQASSTFFGISPYATTNYPNFVFAAGTAKSASPYFSSATLNILSLNVNANMTFDISPYNNNINFMSNNGTFALQVLGTLTNGTGSYTFSGGVPQLITSNLTTLTFPSLIIANSGGNTTTFGGSLTTITSGALTLTSGNLTPGTVTSYTINGVTTLTSGTFTAPTAINQNGNWLNNGGTFVEGTNLVTFTTSSATLGGTQSTTFYNLTCNAGTITLGDNEKILNNLLISAGTLDASTSNYSLTVGQNFTNNSAFTARNGLVTLTGNTSQPLNISGTGGITFYNLTLNPTNATDSVLLGRAITVNGNLNISKGALNCQNFQVTGNATGTMTMAANTTLLLGLTTVATNILFPSNFIAANCNLASTSTVIYRANTNQTVSSVPTYGNVILTNGNAASVKTTTGTPTTIAGNLTLSKGAGVLTLTQATRAINLTGNYTSNGITTFTTGAFNIGGNFTNNGTFTAGTNTVTFDGTANQSLGGTTATTFDLLTINNTGAATITLGNNTTVSSNFTITKGTLDVSASNYSLVVNGNFSNSGGFTARAGTVTLSGAANQNFAGTSTTAFYNLTLPSTHIVTLNHNESVSSVLTLTGATTLNGPDSMITISNASGTARIAPITTGTIGAGFIMQRYVTGSVANYQALGSPAKADILKDWAYDAGFYMSGVGGPYGNSIKNGKVYYSVYYFSEAQNKYDSINTVNQALTPGLGLYLWMGNSLSSFSPFTFETKGIPNVGNVNYTLTKSHTGDNLISNPYESPIQWTSFQTGNSARLGTKFYCFDETTGNWESSNGATASGGRLVANPNIIPAHEGFLVVASSAGVVTFKETYKSVSDAPVIRTFDPENMLRILLSSNTNTFSGHAIIQFDDSASDLYDVNEDAMHLPSLTDGAPLLYSLSTDGEQLIHNTVPATPNKEITFYAGGGNEGMYTLAFSDVNTINKYNCILLEDVANNKWMQVTEASKYSFLVNYTGQTNKFILHFNQLQPGQDCRIPEGESADQVALDGIDIFSSQIGAQVRFSMQTTQDATISVYNMLGEKVEQDIHCSALDNTVEVPLPSTNSIYIVRVQTPAGFKNQRIYR